MPNQTGMNRRIIDARERIKAASLVLGGVPVELNNRRRDKAFSGMLYLEEIADFLDGLIENQGAVAQPAALDIPLEYLTADGLRWVASERGLNIDDVTRKADLLELLED